MTPAGFLFPARRLCDLLHRETTDLAATVHQARALAADLVDAIEAAERRRQYLKHFDGEDHHDQHPGRGQNVLVRCRFFRSAFPPERIFVIRARDGAARQQERRSTDGG
jgi:ribosomal protein S13